MSSNKVEVPEGIDVSKLPVMKEKLEGVLNSSEAKQLADMISGGDSAKLKSAANAAMSGDVKSVQGIMSALMSSKDGAALIEKISKMVKE